MHASLTTWMGTDAAAPGVAVAGRSLAQWLQDVGPEVLRTTEWLGVYAWQWLGILGALLIGVTAGRLIGALLVKTGRFVSRRNLVKWDDELIDAVEGPVRWAVPALVARALIGQLALAPDAFEQAHFAFTLLLLVLATWAADLLVRFLAKFAGRQGRKSLEGVGAEERELRVRGLETQVSVLQRVISVIVWVVGIALVLMRFDTVRTVGLSLLASAGIAGVVLGFAAQRSFASLMAGIQLSLTQPVRIGDSVVVDEQFGTIEEINLTYIVVKLWDERRLVTPVTRFLDKGFYSLTRSTAAVLGTVLFHADYTLPMEAVRERVQALIESNPLWDRRVLKIQLVEAEARTIQIRVLVSAKTSDLFQLRADVREGLIAWLRDFEGGRYLPRVRVEEPQQPAKAL